MTVAAKKRRAKPSGYAGDKPTGKTRAYDVLIEIRARMVLDESVISQGTQDEGHIMRDPTEAQVIEHLAYNLVGNQLSLSEIDGYANCPAESARVTGFDMEVMETILTSWKDR